MPAVMPPPIERMSNDAESQLTQANAKVRIHDYALGGLLLTCIALVYLAAMIVLDRWLELPLWVRQVGWLVALGVLLVIAYRYLLLPGRRNVNPLYTAKLVEQSLPDAKNAVLNWVDLQDQPLPESVREAVSARASRQLANADINRALESKTLVLVGAAAAALVVALAVMFLTFKPMVFTSLAGRAIFPFSDRPIATRTQLELVAPASGHATLVAGEPLTITVHVSGREPDQHAPDRIRLLLRRHATDEYPDEVAMEPIGNREWTVRLPMHLIQNGFLYRVAGGDVITNEYAVQVKPRPVFTDFEVEYLYPPYLNMLPETSRDPHIVAFRGTQVTIHAFANRELKEGRMILKGGSPPILGQVSGNKLTVRFELLENGTYQLIFTALTGETNTDSPPYLLQVLTDQPPSVAFKPTQPEAASLPLNGLLTVDGQASDDFGIDRMSLRLRVQNGPALAQKPYRDGASFRRDADNTWPTTVEYKDSIRIDELKLENGEAANLKPGDVLEYWLEAADNCTVPGPNIGRSAIHTIRLEAPVQEKDARQQQQAAANERKQEEARHEQAADAQRQQELRPKKQGPHGKTADMEQPAQTTPAPTDAKPAEKEKASDPAAEPPSASKPDQPSPPTKNQSSPEQPKRSEEQTQPDQPPQLNQDQTQRQPGQSAETGKSPEPQPQSGQQAETGKSADSQQQSGQPSEMDKSSESRQQAGGKGTPEQLQQKAKEVQDAIDELNQQAGSGKSGEQPSQRETIPKESSVKPSPASGDQPSERKPSPAAAEQSEPSNARNEQPQKPSPPTKPKSSGNNQTEAANQQPQPDTAQQPAGREHAADSGNQQARQQPSTTRPGPQPSDSASQRKEAGSEPGGEKRLPNEANETAGRAKDRQPPQAAEQKPAPTQTTQSSSNPKNLDDQTAAETASTDRADRNPQSANPPRQARANERPSTPGAKDQNKIDAQELQQAARDLASNDPEKQQQARQKLDRAIGEHARKEAEQFMNDLRSDDPDQRQAALNKLKDLDKQLGNNQQPSQPSPEQMKQAEQLAKDLQSNNPAARQAAEKKLDEMLGEDARRQAEQLAKDLQSNDPATRQAAEQKLNEIKQKMEQLAKEQGQSPGKPTPEQMKQAEQLAKDLHSNDPAARQAAEKKLDEMLGEDARQQAEQLAKDLQSNDPATRQAAEQKLNEIKQKMEQLAKEQGQPPGKPTPEQMKQLEDLTRDLKSSDPEKRRAAEQTLDAMLGQDQRKNLQDQLQDNQAGQPLPPSVQDRLQQLANQGKLPPNPRSGGAPAAARTDEARPIDADTSFEKRGGDLQLERFKKERANQELLKKLGWTQEDYDRFVQGYEEMLKRGKDLSAPTGPVVPSPGVPTVNTSGATRVETRTSPNTGRPQVTGTAFAPPGYSEAQKRFLEEARKAAEKNKQ